MAGRKEYSGTGLPIKIAGRSGYFCMPRSVCRLSEFWWGVGGCQKATGRSETCPACHSSYIPSRYVLVKGRCTSKHVTHIRYLTYIPSPDRLIKSRRIIEHITHIRHITHIPAPDWLVESGCLTGHSAEHKIHICNLTHIPAPYRLVKCH